MPIHPNPLNHSFTWQPPSDKHNGHGILLIHGLLDSPFAMHDLAKQFIEQGYIVHAPCLPGHGSTASDLFDFNRGDWKAAAVQAYDTLQPMVDKVFVLGYSLGATLALHLALQNKKIDALVLMAPALKPKTPFAFLSNWHSLISWAYAPAKWSRRAPDLCPHRYSSIPFHALHETRVIMSQIRHALKHQRVNMPIFFCVTADDEIADSTCVINYFLKRNNRHDQLLEYTKSPKQQATKNHTQRSSKFPDDNIIDFSHICLHIAPDNPVLGRDGNYRDFNHYIHRGKRGQQPTRQGAAHNKNLKQFTIQRLSYNPDFAFLVTAIESFLESH